MDLIRRARIVLLGVVVSAAFASGCGEEFSTSESALILPASLHEGYSLALAVALDWSDDVFLRTSGGRGYYFVQSAGGGFAVMDATGRSRNHSFQFHSRTKGSNLVVHLLEGIPWTQEVPDAVPPPPILLHFRPFEELLGSDVVVPSAIQRAESINAQFPDSIPAATEYAARLLSIPTWPEPDFVGDDADSIAWRVDFLVLADFLAAGGPTYGSVARFYLHPDTGESLGAPVVPDNPELYPFPMGFPP
jgi:hypothetical protein